MALDVGDINASSGLAQRIYDLWIANSAACGFGASPPLAAQSMLKAQAYCIAQAVVDEITENGEAYISTSKDALQREVNDVGATVNTQAPSSERSIPLR
jgi:hypothetical protein